MPCRDGRFWLLPEVGIDLKPRPAALEILARLESSPRLRGRRTSTSRSRLLERGCRAEGEAELGKALAYRSVGAGLLIRRLEELLPATA
jgi:hypothetical protein